MEEKGQIWSDRKRIWCGLPWSFTVYTLKEDRLVIRRGLFTVTEDEVRLYRIQDIGMRRTLLQRIFGLGTVLVSSTDTSLGDFALHNIRNASGVRDLLSDQVEKERQSKRVVVQEITGSMDDDKGCPHDRPAHLPHGPQGPR